MPGRADSSTTPMGSRSEQPLHGMSPGEDFLTRGVRPT